MENSRKKFEVMLLVAVIMVIVASDGVTAVLHRVGDKYGWSPSVNYTVWSNSEHFYVGDWLLFNFDKRYYNVLEVNKTNYDNCNDKDFVRNITRGGRDVFQLTEARTYYFLSSGGYCWQGMKAIVDVEIAPQAPAPAPAKNHSPSNPSSLLLVLITLVMVVIVI